VSKTKQIVVTIALSFVLAGCAPTAMLSGISPSSHFDVMPGIRYGDLDRQTLDVYVPRTDIEPLPLIVYFYGGGWIKGEKEHFEFVASSLTQAGYVVVIADYRRYPDAVFPAFIEDGAAAVAWAKANAHEYGADTSKMFLIGHSAGAYNAAMLSMDGRYLAAHGIHTSEITGFVGLSGPYDFLPLGESYLLEVFPEETRQETQPVDYVTADSPDTLLIHGGDDDLVVAENSKSMARTLDEHGVTNTLKVYDGAGHGAIVVALSPPLDFVGRTLIDTTAFLDARRISPDKQLDIVVYGATGEVGSQVVAEALTRGHRVHAVSRNPAQIEIEHENLFPVRGDLLDEDSIREIVAGQDIVVSSIRGVIGDSGQAESALQYIATESLTRILAEDPDGPRLIHVGGSGSLEVEPGVLYADKLPSIVLPKNLEVEIQGQILALELLRESDDVEWTYMTPPKNLTNGPRTGEFRIGGDQVLQDDQGKSRLSRADFAAAVINEAERAQHVGERISVAY